MTETRSTYDAEIECPQCHEPQGVDDGHNNYHCDLCGHMWSVGPVKSAPKITFRVKAIYRPIIPGEWSKTEAEFTFEAKDAAEAARLALAEISGPFIANLKLTVAIVHIDHGE